MSIPLYHSSTPTTPRSPNSQYGSLNDLGSPRALEGEDASSRPNSAQSSSIPKSPTSPLTSSLSRLWMGKGNMKKRSSDPDLTSSLSSSEDEPITTKKRTNATREIMRTSSSLSRSLTDVMLRRLGHKHSTTNISSSSLASSGSMGSAIFSESEMYDDDAVYNEDGTPHTPQSPNIPSSPYSPTRSNKSPTSPSLPSSPVARKLLERDQERNRFVLRLFVGVSIALVVWIAGWSVVLVKWNPTGGKRVGGNVNKPGAVVNSNENLYHVITTTLSKTPPKDLSHHISLSHIQLAIKTGSKTLKSRLPGPLKSYLKKGEYSQIEIFTDSSNLADVVESNEDVSALWELSDAVHQDMSVSLVDVVHRDSKGVDFRTWVADIESGFTRESASTNNNDNTANGKSLQGTNGWKQDQEKFLKGFEYLFHKTSGDKDWYFVVDDDTFVVNNNLRGLLTSGRGEKGFKYWGSGHNFVGCGGVNKIEESPLFAHGGSGIALNKPALTHLITQQNVFTNCINQYSSCPVGDVRLALCLRDAGILMESKFVAVQEFLVPKRLQHFEKTAAKQKSPVDNDITQYHFIPESPFSDKSLWPHDPCQKPVTMHHLPVEKFPVLQTLIDGIVARKVAALFHKPEHAGLEALVSSIGFDIRKLVPVTFSDLFHELSNVEPELKKVFDSALFEKTYQPHGTYKTLNTKSATDCQALCVAQKDLCHAFSFSNARGVCELKMGIVLSGKQASGEWTTGFVPQNYVCREGEDAAAADLAALVRKML